MEGEASSCSSSIKNGVQQSSNCDELFMQRRLMFSDSLKDLKNLRKQLYSAAEYFELSYHKDDYNQLVVETLKDYVTKALVSTVDHLGSVAFKVNGFLDENVNQISSTTIRISCMERRLQTCRGYTDHGGLLQQSSMIKTPKYYKRYIIPEGETIEAIAKPQILYNNHSSGPEEHLHRPKNGFQASTMKSPPPMLVSRKGNSKPPTPKSSPDPGSFTFTRVTSEKRAVSPLRFPLKRSESVANRSTSPYFSNSRNRYPSEPRRTVSLNIYPERESEQRPKKSKSLLKSLLSIHKSKKDGQGKLYRYRD